MKPEIRGPRLCPPRTSRGTFRIGTIVLFLSLTFAISSHAAHVLFNLQDFTTGALTNRTLAIAPLSAPAINNGAIVSKDAVLFNSGTSGSVTASNVAAGSYLCSLAGPRTVTSFTILVPSSSSTLNATGLISSTIAVPGSTVAYSQAAADARFLQSSGTVAFGDGTNGSFSVSSNAQFILLPAGQILIDGTGTPGSRRAEIILAGTNSFIRFNNGGGINDANATRVWKFNSTATADSNNVATLADLPTSFASVSLTNPAGTGWIITSQISEYEGSFTNYEIVLRSQPPINGPGGGDGLLKICSNLSPNTNAAWLSWKGDLSASKDGTWSNAMKIIQISLVANTIVVGGPSNSFVRITSSNAFWQFNGATQILDNASNRILDGDGAVMGLNPDGAYTVFGPFRGNGAGITNYVSQTGAYYPSNGLTAATVAAGMTNGGGWVGMMSNAYQCAWMSNNVMNWKKLAP